MKGSLYKWRGCSEYFIPQFSYPRYPFKTLLPRPNIETEPQFDTTAFAMYFNRMSFIQANRLRRRYPSLCTPHPLISFPQGNLTHLNVRLGERDFPVPAPLSGPCPFVLSSQANMSPDSVITLVLGIAGIGVALGIDCELYDRTSRCVLSCLPCRNE